jgi:hypothetical protein
MWWNEHRPLLLQTASLGPIDMAQRHPDGCDEDLNPTKPGPSFQGFRVIQVVDNTIDKIRYVTLRDLRQYRYVMPFEDRLPIHAVLHMMMR